MGWRGVLRHGACQNEAARGSIVVSLGGSGPRWM